MQNKVLTILNTGIFPGDVMFCCGFKYNEILNILKKDDCKHWIKSIKHHKDLISTSQYCAAKTSFKKSGITTYFIFLKDSFGFDDASYVALAHE